MKVKTKKDRRRRISMRQRKKVGGTAERPRLVVFRSLAHISAQVIDDTTGTTVASASSTEAAGRGGNVAGAQVIGKLVAERTLEKGITSVVFDRGGFLYHGRVRKVADAARDAGLKF
mgnify:CR=1 FL=1